MKKTLFAFLILTLVVSGSALAKGSKPTLPAPANVAATLNCDGSVSVTWDPVTGAGTIKYSIEVTVEYNNLSASDCSTTNVTTEYSFDSATNSITIPASAFVVDFGNGPQSPCLYDSACVKALNPPQPKIGSQDNPFTCATVTVGAC